MCKEFQEVKCAKWETAWLCCKKIVNIVLNVLKERGGGGGDGWESLWMWKCFDMDMYLFHMCYHTMQLYMRWHASAKARTDMQNLHADFHCFNCCILSTLVRQLHFMFVLMTHKWLKKKKKKKKEKKRVLFIRMEQKNAPKFMKYWTLCN